MIVDAKNLIMGRMLTFVTKKGGSDMSDKFVCKCGEQNEVLLITVKGEAMCEDCVNRELSLKELIEQINKIDLVPEHKYTTGEHIGFNICKDMIVAIIKNGQQ